MSIKVNETTTTTVDEGLTKEQLISKLEDTLSQLKADTHTPQDLAVFSSQVALNFMKMSTKVQSGDYEENPGEILVDIMAPIKNILGDLGEGEKYFDKVENIITQLGNADTEKDVIDIAMREIVDSGWELKIDINGDGKQVSLINGTEIMNIGKTLLSGEPLNAENLLLGLSGKLEKEVFGFSIVETAQEFNTLAKLMGSKNPEDLKLESMVGFLDSVVGRMGGPRLSPMLNQMISALTELNEVKVMSDSLKKDAVNKFKGKLSKILNGKGHETTTTLPPEETTTTVEPEQPIPAPGPNNLDKQAVDEALESALVLYEGSEEFDYIS